MPLASEMTSGRTAVRIITSGAARRAAVMRSMDTGATAARPTPAVAPAVVRTNSRRLIESLLMRCRGRGPRHYRAVRGGALLARPTPVRLVTDLGDEWPDEWPLRCVLSRPWTPT